MYDFKQEMRAHSIYETKSRLELIRSIKMIVTVKANHKDSTSNFSTISWSDTLRVQRRLTVLHNADGHENYWNRSIRLLRIARNPYVSAFVHSWSVSVILVHEAVV